MKSVSVATVFLLLSFIQVSSASNLRRVRETEDAKDEAILVVGKEEATTPLDQQEDEPRELGPFRKIRRFFRRCFTNGNPTDCERLCEFSPDSCWNICQFLDQTDRCEELAALDFCPPDCSSNIADGAPVEEPGNTGRGWNAPGSIQGWTVP